MHLGKTSLRIELLALDQKLLESSVIFRYRLSYTRATRDGYALGGGDISVTLSMDIINLSRLMMNVKLL